MLPAGREAIGHRIEDLRRRKIRRQFERNHKHLSILENRNMRVRGRMAGFAGFLGSGSTATGSRSRELRLR